MSYWAHHLTTIISVTLVLLLMGMIAMVWISADHETRRLKEQIELSVIMADSIPLGSARALSEQLMKEPFAHQVKYISKEEALNNWTAETGENLEEVFGVNPLSEEISISLNENYATASGIAAIKKQLEKNPIVEAVSSPETEMVESMNSNISRLTLILSAVAAIMLVISFVLINNTVHLTIYSRRFTIHTMQLVGATNSFIRRPVITGNLLAGLIAGVLASALIAIAMVSISRTWLPEIYNFIPWHVFGIIAGALILMGMTLCALASCVSANIYLRKDYDKLFK